METGKLQKNSMLTSQGLEDGASKKTSWGKPKSPVKAFMETLHDGQNLKIILSTGFLKCDQLVEVSQLSLHGSKPRH